MGLAEWIIDDTCHVLFYFFRIGIALFGSRIVCDGLLPLLIKLQKSRKEMCDLLAYATGTNKNNKIGVINDPRRQLYSPKN